MLSAILIMNAHLKLLLYFFLFLVGWDQVSWYRSHYWPIVPAPDDRWLWINWRNENRQGKPKYSEKTYPSTTLSTTNPTWLELGLNPGRCGGKPATNHLSYGAASPDAYSNVACTVITTQYPHFFPPKLQLGRHTLLSVWISEVQHHDRDACRFK
jgi:hypothetical protein